MGVHVSVFERVCVSGCACEWVYERESGCVVVRVCVVGTRGGRQLRDKECFLNFLLSSNNEESMSADLILSLSIYLSDTHSHTSRYMQTLSLSLHTQTHSCTQEIFKFGYLVGTAQIKNEILIT